MNLKKISKERLASLFLDVFNETMEAAEPWYQKELVDNLGITKAEANTLGISWIFDIEDEED